MRALAIVLVLLGALAAPMALAGMLGGPGALMNTVSGGAGTPPAAVCLLAGVGSKLLADTGSCLRAQ